ncbi:MAG TPA: hydroxyacid dehydrogenase [Saprospiraceae bacterium]|nr:hydroxyacid dehydrogenase [Saprospiraceae bacterium]
MPQKKAIRRVYITDDVHPLLIEGLKELGYEVDYAPKVPLATVRKKIKNYDGIIINSKVLMDRAMLDGAPKLRFIGRLGSGLEIIDLAYAKKKGVKVFRAPAGNSNAVGEHALGMLLALSNNLIKSNLEVKSMVWDREGNRGFELKGKTIGIIGFGHTGSQFARKLKGFQTKILVYDKYRQRLPDEFRYVTRIKNLDTLLSRADVLSFHLPLTEETVGFFDEKKLEKCKDGVIIVNTSRGLVIPTSVLINGLESGKIKGACLDVFENEKPKTYSENEKKTYRTLLAMPNVIVSPHVAGWTVESKRKLSEILLRQIKRLDKNG